MIKIALKEHGKLKWLDLECPDCKSKNHESIIIGTSPRTKTIECFHCHAKFSVSWDAEDET